MIESQVKKIAHELRLFGILKSFESRCAAALADSQHPHEMLLSLLEEERSHRQMVTTKRLVTQAKFRSHADLEDWDQTFDRGVSPAKMKEICSLNFVQRKENLLIYGKTGEGKTQLAISIGRRLCLEGMTTKFFSVSLLLEEIQAERAAGKYLDFIKKIRKTDVLILDDFGLRNYTHEEATALMDILEERYRKGIQIVTSQVNAKGWVKLFDDPVIAEAIVDRLEHPSVLLTLKGGSYRERLGKKALKTQTKTDM
jgi:DNA replication protein DnaC